MKKNITRTLSIVMAASVLFALFALAGCGKGKNADSASAQENEAAAKSAVAQRSSPGDGKKVYFASPLFNVAEREYNLKLVHLLERYGYEVFLPQRDGYLAPDLQNMTEMDINPMITGCFVKLFYNLDGDALFTELEEYLKANPL